MFVAGAVGMRTRRMMKMQGSHEDLILLSAMASSIEVSPEMQSAFSAGLESARKHSSVGAGRVVGRDSGGKRKSPKVGRNDICVCGSGVKFKKCCMRKGASDA